jgi:hypothetical protein
LPGRPARGAVYRRNALLAIRGPSASACYFIQTTLGCTSQVEAKLAKP